MMFYQLENLHISVYSGYALQDCAHNKTHFRTLNNTILFLSKHLLEVLKFEWT